MEGRKFFFVAQFHIFYNQTNTSACFLEPVFSLETHEPPHGASGCRDFCAFQCCLVQGVTDSLVDGTNFD